MLSVRKDIRDNWIWNPKSIRILTISFTVAAIVMTVVLYPVMGLYSLLNLIFLLIPVGIGQMSGKVGKKVHGLKDGFSADDGELAECLMVHGYIESPGVAVLGDNDLTLSPIVGKRVTLKLSDIRSYRQVGFFNGNALIGKKGFYLDTGVKKRLGFALVEDTAKRWALRFKEEGIRSIR
jgi:hypothetical protein